jgi:hypothetical protein
VYVAGLLDGNRAYAAVLSGFTVALVAIQQIDNPEHVFEAGMMRGAGILVGIASLTIVSDLLWAPNRHSKLVEQLADIRRRVGNYAKSAILGKHPWIGRGPVRGGSYQDTRSQRSSARGSGNAEKASTVHEGALRDHPFSIASQRFENAMRQPRSVPLAGQLLRHLRVEQGEAAFSRRLRARRRRRAFQAG